VVIAACKKDPELPIESQDPVFYLQAVVEGFNERIEAGSGTYFMYTDYHHHDGILHLEGNIRQFECNPCVRSFGISWAEHGQKASFDFQSHFSNRAQQYLQPQDLLVNEMVQVSFFEEPNPDLGPIEYSSWDFGDGQWSTENNPVVNYSLSNGSEVNVLHVMTYSTPNGICTHRQYNTLNLNTECIADFEVKNLGNNQVQLVARSTGVEPTEYEWHLEDTVYKETSPTVSFSTDGAHDVKMVIINPLTVCYSEITKRVLINAQDCEANWHYKMERIFVEPSDSLRLGKLDLNWTDASGVRYESKLTQQDSSAYFVITDVIPFGKNDEGEEVMCIKGDFQCEMRAVNSGKKIRFEQGKFSLGIAYPKE